MSNVVSLRNNGGDDNGPHLAGEFRCGACTHEWAGTVPVGKWDHLECPNCKRFWGSAKHGIIPPDAIWHCNCGETLFWLTPKGSMCRRCGVISNHWAD